MQITDTSSKPTIKLRIIDTVRTDHYEDIIEFSSYISRTDKLLESIMKKEQ